jgi:hypothetical protein
VNDTPADLIDEATQADWQIVAHELIGDAREALDPPGTRP